MKNKNAKKAALLLTMIIGSQLWGSKELLASGTSHGMVAEGDETVFVRSSNKPEEAASTKTWVEVLKNAEGDLEGKIYRMMADTLIGLTDNQIEKAITSLYGTRLKGENIDEDLKIIDETTGVPFSAGDSDDAETKDKLTQQKNAQLKEFIDQFTPELQESWGDVMEAFEKETHIALGNIVSDQIKLKDYTEINYLKKDKPAKVFIEKIIDKTTNFLKSINEDTSVEEVGKGLEEMAKWAEEPQAEINRIEEFLKKYENYKDDDIRRDIKQVKDENKEIVEHWSTELTKCLQALANKDDDDNLQKIVQALNKCKIFQVKGVFKKEEPKKDDIIGVQENMEVPVDQAEDAKVVIDLDQLETLDSAAIIELNTNGDMTIIDAATRGKVLKGLEVLWRRFGLIKGVKDAVLQSKNVIPIIEEIKKDPDIVKIKKLNQDITNTMSSKINGWSDFAANEMDKNDSNKKVTDKMVEIIKKEVIKRTNMSKEDSALGDVDFNQKIEKLTKAIILLPAKYSYETLKRDEEIKKLLNGWAVDNTFQTGSFMVSEEAVSGEEAVLKNIADEMIKRAKLEEEVENKKEEQQKQKQLKSTVQVKKDGSKVKKEFFVSTMDLLVKKDAVKAAEIKRKMEENENFTEAELKLLNEGIKEANAKEKKEVEEIVQKLSKENREIINLKLQAIDFTNEGPEEIAEKLLKIKQEANKLKSDEEEKLKKQSANGQQGHVELAKTTTTQVAANFTPVGPQPSTTTGPAAAIQKTGGNQIEKRGRKKAVRKSKTNARSRARSNTRTRSKTKARSKSINKKRSRSKSRRRK